MFGIGSTELLVILLVALVVLGPKSLAGVSRTLGKAMGEFRRVSTDFQRTLNAEVAREEEDEKQRKAAEARPASAASQTRPAPEAPR
ncbi:Sec-independent protein translocase protein TatB, partial [uncultured Desulfovibrio sp.]